MQSFSKPQLLKESSRTSSPRWTMRVKLSTSTQTALYGKLPQTVCPRHVSTHAAATRQLQEKLQDSYDASSIQVLEGLEPVRKRPGMYIGSTGQAGLHHLVYEVLDNSIDEVQGGHATRIEVDLDLAGGWVTITDNGRGIPTGLHPRTGKSALETVLTVLHAGGKFGGEASGYSVSGGLHGVGVSVVNALSQHLEVRVWRDGQQHFQQFSRGAPQCTMTTTDLPPAEAARRGTQVRFQHDASIFSAEARYDADTLRDRVRELAFLNSAATILVRVTRPGRSTSRNVSPIPPPVAELLPRDRSPSPDSETTAVVPGTRRGRSASSLSPSAVQETSRGADPSVAHSYGNESEYHSNGHGSNGLTSHGHSSSDPESTHRVAVQWVCPWQPSDSPSGSGNGAGSSRGSRQGGTGWQQGMPSTSLDGSMVDALWQAYHYKGGLTEYVSWMNKGRKTLHSTIYLNKTSEGVGVEAALQWCDDSYSDAGLAGFANSIRTVDGGTHLEGARAAVVKCVQGLVKRLKLIKESDPPLSGDHIREGLQGVISVKVKDPEFEGQTKTRLGNPEVKRIVESVVAAEVSVWLETNPEPLRAIVAKAVMASRAADAARRARDLVRRKSVLTRTMLPGKLADCTSNNRDETEIFIVEGDSAGGSAKQARDRHTQAVLPLRGKILNVERQDESTMLKNQQISNLIVALGLGPKDEGCTGLRYGKVVILTDADVDGAHIRTLLLTFLFRYRPELFHEGHVYVAVPPLYKVETARGAITWVFNDSQLAEVQKSAGASATVQRFKGLGEMQPDQLWATTLDPSTRTLRRLSVVDVDRASRMFSTLMGDKVAPRRQMIEEHASSFSLADLDI